MSLTIIFNIYAAPACACNMTILLLDKELKEGSIQPGSRGIGDRRSEIGDRERGTGHIWTLHGQLVNWVGPSVGVLAAQPFCCFRLDC